jgi:hypothetical protein
LHRAVSALEPAAFSVPLLNSNTTISQRFSPIGERRAGVYLLLDA